SPQHMNYPLGDVVTGLFGAFAIAAALSGRAKLPAGAPRGSEIDLAATEALFRMLDPLAAEYQHMDFVRERTGARSHYSALSNIFATQDGHWLTVVGTSGTTHKRMFEAMGRADLMEAERFATPGARLQNSDEMDRFVSDWCRSHPLRELESVLQKHQVPHSKVYTIADTVADPQFRAREAVIRLPDPELGQMAAP
ncbi:MAG: CoA transferase, partial [Anaerolineales bacterium]